MINHIGLKYSIKKLNFKCVMQYKAWRFLGCNDEYCVIVTGVDGTLHYNCFTALCP